MPLTPPGLTAVLVPALIASGNIGTGVPKLCLGIANGVVGWSGVSKVSITGTGTIGTGVVTFPPIVLQPVLYANLIQGVASEGLLGIMAPLFVLGVSVGLTTGLVTQSLIFGVVPGVGTGVGVAKITGPSAIPLMVQGFASAGLTGSQAARMARALGKGLDIYFASFVMPVPIVGPSGPVPGAGSTVGQII